MCELWDANGCFSRAAPSALPSQSIHSCALLRTRSSQSAGCLSHRAAMAPKKPAAPPPPPPPDEEEIDLFQNPIKKVPVKYLWMGIFLLTVICLIILFLTIKAYNALLAEDWSPYDVPMKKLRTTLSIGLRNRNVMYYQNPLKVSAIVEDIPQHLKDSEEAYRAEKKKYQALYKKGVKFGNDWKLFGWNFYYVSKANERKTWHDAEYFCKSRDSHLTSVLNEEEQKYLSSKLNESAWIGLTDENVEGYWEWSDNSRLIVNSKTSSERPSG
ncbi:putative antigen E [Crotalus adamanteus]|uniref:Antigen E n=1 Tax=Crotalus adamanteus TaxID=8729 RepID=A0AAW1B8J0_CROAD